MISEMAKDPISAGRIDIPAARSTLPKENRGYPIVISSPTVDKKSPKTRAIVPLTWEPREMMTAQDRPKTVSQKYS